MTTRRAMPRALTAALAAALLIFGTASAAEAPDASADTDWYQVEVIIFHQSDDANIHSTEVWPTDPPAPQFPNYAALRTKDGSSSTATVPFEEVPDADMELGGAEASLRRSSVYTPLLHVAWFQPGYPKDQAPAVRIPIDALPVGMSNPSADAGSSPQGAGTTPSGDGSNAQGTQNDGAQPPPQLSGYMRMYRERYLHFEVNLRYRPETSGGDNGYQYNSEGYFEAARPVVVMKQHRRMRSGELHYLDNPALGVLVKITPVKAPAPATNVGSGRSQGSDQGSQGAQ